MEIWKHINGYDNYSVSNKGRVRNDKTGNILTNVLRQPGYYQITLYNPKRTLHYVHRLVADAFIPNPNNYPCVNHIDECKTNNDISNLEWCNFQHNITHGTRIDRARKKQQHSMLGKKNNTIKVIVDGVVYDSIKEAATQCECCVKTLSHYLHNGCTEINRHSITLPKMSCTSKTIIQETL